MSSLVRCEHCGSPNVAVSTSCSTCGAPRIQASSQLTNQFALNGRPNIYMTSDTGSTVRGASPSVDSFATRRPPGGPSAAASTIGPPVSQRFLSASAAPSNRYDDEASFAEENRVASSQKLLASTFPLIGAGEDGKYSEQQVKQLLEVIEASQRYGKDIEQSVEELAELLRKKTIECDGLRAIAQENYDPLRNAVKQEYNARVKQESRHAQEQRRLQSQVEVLRNERAKLQLELESLRQLVKELQSTPAPVDYNSSSNTLLNQMLRSRAGDGDLTGARPTMNAALKGAAAVSWFTPQDPAMQSPQQRELVNYILSLNSEQSRAMQSSGTFDFIKVLCRRMCTPLSDGTFPELGVAAGELVRDMRMGTDLAAQAAQPMPTLQPSWRQRVSQIFLANNPTKGQQLALLLDEYRGREEELYYKIKAEYESLNQPNFDEVDDQYGNPSINQRLGYRSALDAKNGAASIQPTTKSTSVEDHELHARCIIMYKKYNPAKATSREVQEMLKKYPPEVLLAALVEKYGPEPTAVERRNLVRSLMDEAGGSSLLPAGGGSP